MPKWSPLVLALVLGFGAVALAQGTVPDSLEAARLAARWTARVGFPIFLTAYSASSLVRLWPDALTRALMAGRRWWGLGFAATHSIHLWALWRFLAISGETRPLAVFIGAGGAYVMMYLMALTSNRWAMIRLGRNWARLHTVGIHWLWGIFFVSYLGRIFKHGSMTSGVIGTALALAALATRIAARRQARGATPTPSDRAVSPAA